MRWGLRPVVVAVLACLPAAVSAEEASRVADADLARALEAAGANRPELEAFLARFDPRGAEEREAARFLVANLPGKGHALFELRDEAGAAIPFDPLSFETFAAAQEAFEAIEAERGPVDFVRARVVEDVAAVRADALARHVERALAVWRATPAARRPGFDAFLEHVLPHRGSEEPLDDWLGPLADRWAARAAAEADAAALYAAVVREAGEEVRFDERYYLHPTDQGFSEMARSRMGRCEDITNRTTYGARAVGLATAADFTPAWGHRDNNHAWNVLLDARGRGSDPVGRRAPKVYRKTFAIQRDALASRLPPGREAPNRWLGSRTLLDVTDQYGETATLDVELDPAAAGPERFAYLAVFNGGDWVAVAWAPVEGGRARFPSVGRGLLYLPAVHDGARLVPAAAPRVVEAGGGVSVLAARGVLGPATLAATSPEQRSVDTGERSAASALTPGTAYVLERWTPSGWARLEAVTPADASPVRAASGLAPDGLYRLLGGGPRRLERPFTVEDGRQRFW